MKLLAGVVEHLEVKQSIKIFLKIYFSGCMKFKEHFND